MSKYPFLFLESKHCDCKKNWKIKKERQLQLLTLTCLKIKKPADKTGFLFYLIRVIY